MSDIQDIYELSPIQQGMLSDSLAAKDAGMYLIQLSYALEGELNMDAFAGAWQNVIARHDVLRTSFHWEGLEKPVQVVHRKTNFSIESLDWSASSPEEQQEKLTALHQENQTRGVIFTQAPLLGFTLIRMGGSALHFIWTFHHILFEGWSASLLLQEVFAFYRATLKNETLRLNPSKQYREYISWLHSQDQTQAEIFWRSRLADFMSPTPLGMGGAASGTLAPVADYDARQITLSADATARLNSFARKHHLTMNTLVQAGWAFLLSAYSREQDVLFGTIVSGRSIDLDGVEAMVGLFINILPMRVQLSDNTDLLAWLKIVQNSQVEARKYEHSPLVNVKGWSEVQPGTPLFDSIVIFENWLGEVSLHDLADGLQVKDVVGYNGAPGYALAVVVEPGTRLNISITYDRQRFTEENIQRTLQHFEKILLNFVAAENQKVGDLSLLTAGEQKRLLQEWNETPRGYSEDSCIHQLFEARVLANPDVVALVHEKEQLTYAELNLRANRLAHRLKKAGVGPDVAVGLCINRNTAMVVGLLGILKAGGAYVPLDPEYPPARIEFMIQDSQIEMLLTESSLLERLPAIVPTTLCLDSDLQDVGVEETGNIETGVQPLNMAYVIYTSGSTGQPKGVVVPHRSLVNYVEAAISKFEVQPADRFLQFASISFDTAAEEIFPALLSGATLVLRNEEMLDSISTFLQKCDAWQISVLDLPTAYWHELINRVAAEQLALPACLRLVIVGGERALPEMVAKWHQYSGEKPRLLNTYGPTETTIVATTAELSGAGNRDAVLVPIGQAIPNTSTYVLDRKLQPVPVGLTGELFIGGAAVTRGYLRRPDLTAEKFMPDPFSDMPGNRLYKTGDLVRYRPDGNLEFLGRTDHQVKIRGFRIELGEVEASLRQHNGIADAVVIAPDEEQIVAYVVTRADAGISMSDLRTWLIEKLPHYMLPQSFVFLDALPRTPSGKINTGALPAPDRERPTLNTGFVAPRTSIEMQIADIWSELLKNDKIGIFDNFFELGGHSLLAIQLQSRLRSAFEVELPLRTLFDGPTIERLAVAVGQSRLALEDKQEIADLLDDLENLSNEDASALLEGEK